MKFTKEIFIKSVFVLSFLCIVLIIAVSFFVFQLLHGRRAGDKINPDVNKKTEETFHIPVQSPIELPKVLYNLSGPITVLDSGIITFNAAIVRKSANGEIINSTESRKADITAQTKISKLSFVNRSPVEVNLKFEDLKIGDNIEVISDQDISTKPEFSVTRIRVLP